jgi:DUF1009 family protein
MATLAVIAGSGALPELIADARAKAGEPHFVVAFEGQAPGWIGGHPHLVVPFEKPGRLFAALRERGVDRVVFAGGLSRPELSPLRFDFTGIRLAPRVLGLLKKGDDALLRGLAAIFEGEGFAMAAAQDVLAELLAPAGAFSGRVATAEEMEDAAEAARLAGLIGSMDVGQAAVVAGGLCLGLETLQGTDALLEFVGRTDPAVRPGPGVLYKGPKPGQDWRMDLPAIGPETVRRAHAAGLAGIVCRAGAVLVLGLEATRAEADRLGLFLHGLKE